MTVAGDGALASPAAQPGPAAGTRSPGGPDVDVVVVAEQLRRAVPGGIGTYVAALLRALAGLDRCPRLVVHASRSPGRPDPLAAFGWPLAISSWPAPLLQRAWSLGRCRAPDAAVVHSASLAAPPPGRGAALVVVVHDMLWRVRPRDYGRHGYRWHEAAFRRAVARADRLVVPAREVAEQLVGAGAAPERVVVVRWGCDHLPPPDRSGADRVLRALGVAGDEPYMLSVGTLEPRKNLRGLVAAHALARRQLRERWPLVVVGPAGWGRSGLSDADGVLLAGAVDDAVLSGLLVRARLLAYVPWAEGFGLPPVEAMAAGVPVVSSLIPSTVGAALRVDPADTDAIADALVQVATDDAVRRELVDAGRALAARDTWAACASSHVRLWESLR